MAVSILDNTFGVENIAASSPDTFSGANITIPAGDDRLVAVMIQQESGSVPSGVTIGGVAATKAVTVNVSLNDADIWYRAIGSSGSSDSMAVVQTGGSGSWVWGVIALAGVDQTTPLGNTATNTATTTGGVQVSLSADAGSCVIDSYCSGSDVTFTVDSGQTEVGHAIQGSMTGGQSYELHAGATTATLGWTHSTVNRVCTCIAEFLQVSASATILPQMLHHHGG